LFLNYAVAARMWAISIYEWGLQQANPGRETSVDSTSKTNELLCFGFFAM